MPLAWVPRRFYRCTQKFVLRTLPLYGVDGPAANHNARQGLGITDGTSNLQRICENLYCTSCQAVSWLSMVGWSRNRASYSLRPGLEMMSIWVCKRRRYMLIFPCDSHLPILAVDKGRTRRPLVGAIADFRFERGYSDKPVP